ncbi:ABC transporter permease [Yinghuangia sp. YIM S09857]|uniref:ABC transporter permease n=1 Tax=Yinghuangia sp. YIM S09857 TaxID=3436929 RepID=UPI003F52A5E5
MGTLTRWLRNNVVTLFGILALGYMTLPNLVVLLFSFNDPNGKFNYTWNGFSLDAWKHPFGVAGIKDSLITSLEIAVLSTIGATVLGTAVAFALGRYRFRGRGLTNTLLFLPMSMPEVVMGASLGTLFLNMRISFGFWTILIAHVMFCLSFVVVAVKARVLGMDPRLEEAARDLYASPAQTFLRVTLPIAAPGIGAGALLAFSLSFDDFVITNFNSGDTVTFPMFVWGAAQRGTPPQVNVIGSAMFFIAIAIVVVGQLRANRRAKQKAA